MTGSVVDLLRRHGLPVEGGRPNIAGFSGERHPLERQARKQQAVAELGLQALAASDLQGLMDTAAAVVAGVLELEYCNVLELLPNRRSLRLRAGVGWPDGFVGREIINADDSTLAGYTLLTSEPVVVNDLRADTRFGRPRLLRDHGVTSGLSVVIHGATRPYGVLGAFTMSQRDFDDDDIGFVQSVANILSAAFERAAAEDALAESEERFRALVEMAPDVIFSISATDATLTTLSPAFERLTGWSRSEWLGRPFTGLVEPNDLPTAIENFNRVLAGDSPAPFELRIVGKSGEATIGEFRIVPKIENGQVVELFGIGRDVSDRRQAEAELRRSRDELEIILRGVTDGITVQDTSGRLVYANDAAARLTGCSTVDELLLTPIPELMQRFEMFDADGHPFSPERLPGRAALQGREGPEALIRFRVVATGEERWSVVNATPVLDPDGQPRYAINIFHDVTDRRLTELVQDFLAAAASVLATSLDVEETLPRIAHIAVPFMADLCVFDILQPDGSLRRVAAHSDPETERFVHDLIASHPVEPHHPVMLAIETGQTSLFEDVSERTAHDAETLSPERVRMISDLGFRSVIVVPLVARGRRIGALSLIYTESGRRYSQADLPIVTELARRAATAVDNALLYEQSEQAAARLRALAEASRAFAEASLDLGAVLDVVARSAGEMIGDQCILRLLSDDGAFLPAVAIYHPDAGQRAWLTDLMASEIQRADEGYVGQVVTSGQPLLLPTIPRPELETTVTAGHREYVRQTPLHSAVIVLVRVHDQVIGTLGLGRERAGQPYTEEDLLLLQELADRAGLAIENARLYREAQDAIRVREQFLSIASHELKTPLTSVKASAQLLERRLRQQLDDASRVEPLVGQLQNEVGRLESLVADLLDASRIQQGRLELRLEAVELADLVRRVVERFDLAPQRLPEHELTFVASDPVDAVIDPARIDQVVTNLVSNALKYSPDGGEVRVEVMRRNGVAEIVVGDHGLGISAEEQTTLFEPFARGDVARQSIGGTGLGLFISAEIVDRHGGSIEVASELGQGSTFTVRLPLEPGSDAE